VNPADTASNLAYLAVGVWMAFSARDRSGPGLAFFGPAAVAVGLCSGIYHASYTYALQLLDFVGMYLFCFLVIALNAQRLGWIGTGSLLRFYLGGVALFSVSTPLLFETGIPIQGLVGVLIGFSIAQEWTLRRRAQALVRYAAYALALTLLLAAALFSLADVTRTWCDPNDPWQQGHAIWHVLSAVALLALFCFYAGLPDAAPADRDG
jgi:hypothetical protein